MYHTTHDIEHSVSHGDTARAVIELSRRLDAMESSQIPHLLRELTSQIGHFMSALSDQLSTITTNLGNIATGIVALDATIQKLQNTPGVLDATDQAALDAISAQSAALAEAANAVVAAPTVPAPVPPVA